MFLPVKRQSRAASTEASALPRLQRWQDADGVRCRLATANIVALHALKVGNTAMGESEAG